MVLIVIKVIKVIEVIKESLKGKVLREVYTSLTSLLIEYS
jgi:hypothetical protein